MSIEVVTDFQPKDERPDDAVVELEGDRDTLQAKLKAGDFIRLTSLVSKTPVTIATNRDWTKNDARSPFFRISFGETTAPLAIQFEYIVLQKAKP